ncbi:hypothetical protein [Streptomyces sp. NPDC048438]|uniref:hypothetical protein n=1 Tax=Streptomyces sp. NPDC048438 TaxID=3365551 RepID=UPI00371F26D1
MRWSGIERTSAGCRSAATADNGPTVQRELPCPHTMSMTDDGGAASEHVDGPGRGVAGM